MENLAKRAIRDAFWLVVPEGVPRVLWRCWRRHGGRALFFGFPTPRRVYGPAGSTAPPPSPSAARKRRDRPQPPLAADG